MKHLISIVILVIAIVTSGCASSETASEASANRTCFNIREITSWNSIDNKHLYIEGIGSDSKYLFTMFSSCYGIEFSQVIALSNPMSRLCSNDFGRVTYRDGSRRMSCNIDDIEQVASQADAEAETRILGDVVREYIEALTLQNSFDFQIGIDALFAGTQYMGGAQLGVLADKDNFKLQPIKVTLPGGDIDVEYVVERTPDGVGTLLNIYIERLQYGDLVRLLDPDAQQNVRGFLYLDTSLNSSASTTAQLSNAVQGRIELMTIPEDIAAGVLDLWAANLVVALVTPKGFSQPKKLNCMVASFSVDEGVMRSRSVMLDTTDVIIRGRGSIDIANQTIDMIVAPQAKLENFLSMSTPVAITGPWDDFQVGVTKVGLAATLFRWYMGLIYVPYKWLSGERFPADGLTTCFNATDWELPSDSD